MKSTLYMIFFLSLEMLVLWLSFTAQSQEWVGLNHVKRSRQFAY